MDRTSRKILKALKKKQSITISFIDEPFSDIAPPVSVAVSLDFLEKEEYIQIKSSETFNTISISYRGLHPAAYMKRKIISYLGKNWIAIVALVISIIALLKQ